eukprot:CAMPEP_0180414594 /NCGR_PEP_ID=MMETSP0989-20121125/45715_1 /TAXON_ID=697907 /ORGANISM="non described non described, Strain CCMP2293" /LENGTH=149 /DNA_ID=CAMNT_0022419253 /DNA_START=78 /DNA_END=525 /DNA_ORIENTATION=-
MVEEANPLVVERPFLPEQLWVEGEGDEEVVREDGGGQKVRGGRDGCSPWPYGVGGRRLFGAAADLGDLGADGDDVLDVEQQRPVQGLLERACSWERWRIWWRRLMRDGSASDSSYRSAPSQIRHWGGASPEHSARSDRASTDLAARACS